MKILIRKYGDKQYYVWKDAVYKNGQFYIDNKDFGELIVYQVEILAIKDDNRSEYVICSNCGAIIKNDPESIEAHFAAKEAQRDCFKCPSLRKENIKSIKADYAEAEDGNFNVTETYNVDLRCSRNYFNRPRINTEAAKSICIHYQCRKRGVHKIEDIFTKYPDLFNKHITVDALNAKKFEAEGQYNDFFEYDMKLRNTLKAYVNELGIVDHFVVKCRGQRYFVYYSAKYDKLFFSYRGREYTEQLPDYMTENKFNQVKAKISALYKEETSK